MSDETVYLFRKIKEQMEYFVAKPHKFTEFEKNELIELLLEYGVACRKDGAQNKGE